MKGSIYLCTIKGIQVKIHLSFFLIFIWVGYQGYKSNMFIPEILQQFLMVSVLFFCVLLHEFGHAITAKRYGIDTDQIILLPIGGVAQLNKMPEKPMQELAVALGGPAVNVLIALLLIPVLFISNPSLGIGDFFSSSIMNFDSFAVQLFFYNIILLLFNMIPAFPMDGGRVLRALLGLKLNFIKSTQIAARTGQLISLGFIGIGFWYEIYGLILVGLFVFAAAEMEYRMAKRKYNVRGLKVKDAMMNHYNFAHPLENIQSILEKEQSSPSTKDFLVVDNNLVIGILTREALKIALDDREYGPSAFVGTVMKTDYPVVDVNETLDTAIGQMQMNKVNILPVFENNRWIGSIDAERIAELIFQRKAKLHSH